LKSWGVEAYVSYCGTLTLPKRDRRPSLGKVVAVDVENVYVPKSLRRNAVRVSHSIPKIIAHSTRMSFARDLLAFYRDEASLMVTTRLHAALPCAAMGIPVVFLGDSTDGRLGLLAEVGLTINRPLPRRGLGRLFASLADRTEWSPQAVDVELRKVTLSEDIAERVRSVG
jgi:hypothetical protein